MLLFRNLIVIVSIIGFNLTGWSQESIHKKYSISNGLPSNTIYDLRQDKKGFIWIATDLGLCRFDGNTFISFPISGNKSSSVSNILFSDDGNVWVQNFNGQYFKTNNKSLIYQPQISKLSNFNLGHDFDGKTIAVLDNQSVTYYPHSGKNTKRISVSYSFWISSVNSSATYFYLANFKTGESIKLDAQGRITHLNRKIPIQNDYIHWVIDANDEYFIAKINKKIYLKNSGKTVDFSKFLPNSFVQNACLVAEGKIGILTTSGVLIFDVATNKFTKLFSQYSCSKLIQDKEGNWWISTLGDGLLFVPRREAKVYLQGTETTYLQRYGDQLYFGTKNNEIYQYDVQSKVLKLLKKDNENHEVKSVFVNQKTNDILYCSVIFHAHINGQKQKDLSISVNQITQLDDDHYLLCESNNLSIYPVIKNGPWSDWSTLKNGLNGERLCLFTGNKRFLQAVFNGKEILALASDGLWLIQKKKVQRLSIGKTDTDVIHLSTSNQGVVITTSNDGIYLYSNHKLIHLTKINRELKSQRLFKTKFINNNCYVLTYSGMLIFDDNHRFLQQLMVTDGYPNVDINDFEVLNNTIYASSTNGFQIIPIPKEKQKRHTPVVILNDFYVNGVQFPFKKGMILKPDENSLLLDFSVLNYRALGMNHLYYSINGKKWHSVDDNKLRLNELAPGKYEVQIYSSTNNTSQKSVVSTYAFEIQAPFYQQWWFTGLVLLALVFIGFILFKVRINQVQQKNQMLEEKLNLEKQLHESSLSAIKSQMNPHFLFNALNTIQSFIYTNEKEAASAYLVDFSELTRKILEMSNQPYVLLSEELEALRLYLKLEKMRFEEDFDFSINTEKLPHETFKIPSMLIQPYVENAIKHGLLHKKGEKRIQLLFKLKDTGLQVSIIDNGIGLNASKKINASRNPNHQSFATVANHKRFELLNQLTEGQIGVSIEELLDNEKKVIGTAVQLSIPVQI